MQIPICTIGNNQTLKYKIKLINDVEGMITKPDIKLSQLADQEKMSSRATKICRDNGLNTLSKIIDCYQKHGSFEMFSNCGEKSNHELIEISKKYIDLYSFPCGNEQGPHIENIPAEKENIKASHPAPRGINFENINGVFLNKIFLGFNSEQVENLELYTQNLVRLLSNRARNSFFRFFRRYPNSKDLISALFEHNLDFLSVENIGLKTANELISFKNALAYYLLSHEEFKSLTLEQFNDVLVKKSDEEVVLQKYSLLTPFKKASLIRNVDYLTSQLSVRAQNGIASLFESKPTENEIISKIFTKDFNFGDIKNIGEKTTNEILSFKQNIASFILSIENFDHLLLSKEYTKLLCKTTFKQLPSDFDDSIDKLFDDTGRVKLFRLLDMLIVTNNIFNSREKILFDHLFRTTNNKSIADVANEAGVTKERARQIKMRIDSEIQDYFAFVSNLNKENTPKYGLSLDLTFTIVDESTSQKINDLESVDFNTRFYAIILGIIHKHTHSVLGDDEILSEKNVKSGSNRLRCFYLIENQISEGFNFAQFIDDVNTLVGKKKKDDYVIYFDGFLSSYFKDSFNYKVYSDVKYVCEQIVFNEYELVVNSEGYLIFEHNKNKLLSNYVIEALSDLNEMTKVEEIVNYLNRKYPHKDFKEPSIRALLGRERENFIYIGRSSTYGLRRWEDERGNLRGGTIRDLVEEYLLLENEPKHISEIMDYVLRYRDTTLISVSGNIKLDANRRFVYFNGEYIGIKGKEYSDIHLYKRVFAVHFTKSALRKCNGWDLSKVVAYLIHKHGYKEAQVRYMLSRKIESGEYTVNLENKLVL